MKLHTPMGFELEIFDPLGQTEARYVAALQAVQRATSDVTFSQRFAHHDWTQHRDGGGIEIGSPVFTNSEQLECIRNVTKALFNHGFRPDRRAGVHIHLSRSRFETIEKQAAFQRFMISVEAGIFAISSLARVSNLFGAPYVERLGGLPLDVSENTRAKFKRAGFDHPFLVFERQPTLDPHDEFLTGQVMSDRAFSGWVTGNDLGTFECRCFPSTLDGRTIQNWMRTLNLLVPKFQTEYAKWRTKGHFPYKFAGWSGALDCLAEVADQFMEYIGAAPDLRQWAVERASANFVLPIQSIETVLPAKPDESPRVYVTSQTQKASLRASWKRGAMRVRSI